MGKKITILKGDGIGPDIVKEAISLIETISTKWKIDFSLDFAPIGGEALDATGSPLPDETIEKCRSSDAVLLGAVGGPKWDNLQGDKRPEAGLLGIRKALGLFANLRPAKMFEPLSNACLLRPETAKHGLDVMIIRELTGGIYFGKRGYIGSKQAFDTMIYSEDEVNRIARVAFTVALARSKKLTNVDKANVLESSRLWRRCVVEVGEEFPEVELNHMYVDNAAMQLVRDPSQFDVVLAGNMFGDILSDEASMITGSIGMLPSASLREDNFGLYEPIHGSAPDIAGQDKANPLATILSVAMMFGHTFGKTDIANQIEKATLEVLQKGFRTADIFTEGTKLVGTREMGDLVKDEIAQF